MAVYAFWNNKGGVGKSYLTFQIASEYARVHPEKKILVIDLCPQANASGMLLGGMKSGEGALDVLSTRTPRKTISGYIEDRISSPYVNPKTGAQFVISVSEQNALKNLLLYREPPDSVHQVGEGIQNGCK
jgi:cellulose biosynthesis protein BcsQ